MKKYKIAAIVCISFLLILGTGLVSAKENTGPSNLWFLKVDQNEKVQQLDTAIDENQTFKDVVATLFQSLQEATPETEHHFVLIDVGDATGDEALKQANTMITDQLPKETATDGVEKDQNTTDTEATKEATPEETSESPEEAVNESAQPSLETQTAEEPSTVTVEQGSDSENDAEQENASSSTLSVQSQISVEAMVNATGKNRVALFGESEPTVGSMAGDWTILGLARSGLGNQVLYETYYDNVCDVLKENDGVLSKNKMTEYDRVILSLTAIGKDVTNVAGYDLLSALTDLDDIKKQGINGPIWALIALDSHDYPIYDNAEASDQNSRQKMVDYILSKEIVNETTGVKGGWSLIGDVPDADMTGMAIYALERYKDQPEVADAIERGFDYLESVQCSQESDSASFGGSSGSNNLEATAQVLMAMVGDGIDVNTDTRFIKNDATIIDAINGFYLEDSTYGAGFMHIKTGETSDGGGAAGVWDPMATDQAMEALISYLRVENGQTSIFDMRDVDITSVPIDYFTLNQQKGLFDCDQTYNNELIATIGPTNFTEDYQIQWSCDDYEGITLQEDEQDALKATVHITAGCNAPTTQPVEVTATLTTEDGQVYTAVYQMYFNPPAEDVQSLIDALPAPYQFETGDMDALVFASSAYDLLSNEAKKNIDTTRLFDNQTAAAEINHTVIVPFESDNEIIYPKIFTLEAVSGNSAIPWNVKLGVSSVDVQTESLIEQSVIGENAGNMISQLCNIELIQLTADGTEASFKPDDAVQITMQIPEISQLEIEKTALYHYSIETGGTSLTSDSLDYQLEEGLTSRTITFKTKTFSPFAVVLTPRISTSSDSDSEPLVQQLMSSNYNGIGMSTLPSSTTHSYYTVKTSSENADTGETTEESKLKIGDSDISFVEATAGQTTQIQSVTDQGSLAYHFLQKMKEDFLPFVIGMLFMALILAVGIMIHSARKK